MKEKNNFINTNNMDDSEANKQRKNSNMVSIFRNFFQSFGIRCTSEVAHGYNGQLLVFNFNFLPCLAILFYFILLIG